MENTPPIENGWRWAAMILADERKWDYFRAYDHEIVRYLLKAGDCRPLLDLILLQGRAPGRRVAEYIAAMIDPEFMAKFENANFPFVIGFEENRGRGRPKKQGPDPHLVAVVRLLLNGPKEIDRGNPADQRFWLYLAYALALNRKGFKIFPIKAKTFSAVRRQGDHPDPELSARDALLAFFVESNISGGCKYVSAVDDVGQQIKAIAKLEGWKGWIGEQTIRDAYDSRRRT